MKPEDNEKIIRFMLSIICFIAYMYIFTIVMAHAFGGDLHHSLLA